LRFGNLVFDMVAMHQFIISKSQTWVHAATYVCMYLHTCLMAADVDASVSKHFLKNKSKDWSQHKMRALLEKSFNKYWKIMIISKIETYFSKDCPDCEIAKSGHTGRFIDFRSQWIALQLCEGSFSGWAYIVHQLLLPNLKIPTVKMSSVKMSTSI
jgi:hypothetical protein